MSTIETTRIARGLSGKCSECLRSFVRLVSRRQWAQARILEHAHENGRHFHWHRTDLGGWSW